MTHPLLNPLGVASALFLVIAPFLTWMTIVSLVVYQGFVVFGTAAQSSLLMVSSQQSGMAISQAAARGATASAILLPLAGLLMLKSARLGVPLGLVGVIAYVLPMSPVFGTQTFGYQLTFVSPGIGLFVASAGVLVGSLSPMAEPASPPSLLKSLTTRRGLASLGVFTGVAGLSLDILNHAALGQLSDFIGSGLTEQSLHLGLVAGLEASLIISLVGRGHVRDRGLFLVSVATLSLLGGDFAYSIATGSLHGFLGHNLTETSLHFMVYYGVALTIISVLGRTTAFPGAPPRSGPLPLPSP